MYDTVRTLRGEIVGVSFGSANAPELKPTESFMVPCFQPDGSGLGAELGAPLQAQVTIEVGYSPVLLPLRVKKRSSFTGLMDSSRMFHWFPIPTIR